MDLARLRKKLALTQSGLGRIVGAHAMTVSKWERGVLRPSGFQLSILAVLDAAASGRRVSGPAHELAGYLNDALIDSVMGWSCAPEKADWACARAPRARREWVV